MFQPLFVAYVVENNFPFNLDRKSTVSFTAVGVSSTVQYSAVLKFEFPTERKTSTVRAAFMGTNLVQNSRSCPRFSQQDFVSLFMVKNVRKKNFQDFQMAGNVPSWQNFDPKIL